MNKVLNWVKANVFTVLFIVVMIAALVTLPIIAGRMNDAIRKDVQARLSKKSALEGLKRTSIEHQIPGTEFGFNGSGIVNERFVERFRALVEAEDEDAVEVLAIAEKHNAKGRTVIAPDDASTLFPAPVPAGMRDVLPGKFHRRLVTAYDALLLEVHAGGPPDPEEIAQDVERRRRQFLTSKLQKEVGDALTAEEQVRLAEYLSEARLGLYQERADELSFYCPKSVLAIPGWDFTVAYPLDLLFLWQWDLWVTEDILHALAEANGEDVVRSAPVKRVVALHVHGLEAPSGGGGSGGGGGGGMGGLSPGSSGGGGMGGSAAAPVLPVDPTQPVTRDYSRTFTGRQTNGIYDVRYVTLELDVATASLPEVLDAIARRNLMTVIDLSLVPGDPFAAAREGYYYGPDPVSRVVLQIETIWLRTWTTAFMPDELRAVLGVPLASAGAGDSMNDPNG